MVLFEEIETMRYKGKTAIRWDFIQPPRSEPKKQSTVRFETPPDKQAQIDWAEIGMFEVDDKLQKVYAFIMILSYSRIKYIVFTTDIKLEMLMKCYMNAFAYFNNVLEHILYNNMKIVIIKHNPVEVQFNHKFECFLAHYEIIPTVCKPSHPQTKRKVKRTVHY
ncbi:hypothetical protein [Metabacillus fastidiosus]|uniref:hypothetical protein n=1 Tax=Metabacillus fastidiosus TaxID=1458 RepID=UPI003D2E07F2